MSRPSVSGGTIDGEIHERSARAPGIFRDFSGMVDLALLPPDIARPARQAMRWFNDELPVPRLGKQNAICWFRASQQEMIDRAFDLIAALRAAGHQVQQLQTDRPGRCLYEDPYQVAAIPWRDTNLEGKPV